LKGKSNDGLFLQKRKSRKMKKKGGGCAYYAQGAKASRGGA